MQPNSSTILASLEVQKLQNTRAEVLVFVSLEEVTQEGKILSILTLFVEVIHSFFAHILDLGFPWLI